MRGLTERQSEVLDTIRFFVQANGYPPTIRELQPLINVACNRSVTVHLDALEQKGYIRRGANPREIQLLKSEAGNELTCIYVPKKWVEALELRLLDEVDG